MIEKYGDSVLNVETEVNKPVKHVWNYWNNPKHIVKWNLASNEWECPKAENNLIIGGNFSYTMAAKDGSAKFEFEGTYTTIEEFERIEYTLKDGRMVVIEFIAEANRTKIKESFVPDNSTSHEFQKSGWQAILDNFKKYIEEKNE